MPEKTYTPIRGHEVLRDLEGQIINEGAAEVLISWHQYVSKRNGRDAEQH